MKSVEFVPLCPISFARGCENPSPPDESSTEFIQDRLENCDGRGVGVLQVPDTRAHEAGGHEDQGVPTKPYDVTANKLVTKLQVDVMNMSVTKYFVHKKYMNSIYS